jgi:hypothetical protein
MAPFISDESSMSGSVTESMNTLKVATESSPKLNYLPVKNPGECFWQQEPHPLHSYRSTEDVPSQTDILIIGAGYAGIATAYHLTKNPSTFPATPSITILEARSACSGATGRNGGHLRPDLYGHIPTYVDRAGAEAGAEIARFEIAHVQAIKKVVETEKIDCDFTLCRSFDVWCNEEAAGKAEEVYERMKALEMEGEGWMDDVVFYSGMRIDVEGVSFSLILRVEDRERSADDDEIDLWRQRRKSMCLLHGGYDLAIQIHLSHTQDHSCVRKCQSPDTYVRHLDSS